MFTAGDFLKKFLTCSEIRDFIGEKEDGKEKGEGEEKEDDNPLVFDSSLHQ